MDKRSEERMLTVFKMNFKDQCEYTDINDADTVIIDMDDKNVDSEWADFRVKHPDIPVIITAKEHLDLIGAIYISKPAKLAELLDALKETSNKEISSNLTTSHNNTHNAAKSLQQRFQKTTHHNSESSNNFELFYDPEKFLQGQIVRAVKESNKMDKSIFIKYWNDQWIIIFPNSNFLIKNVNASQVKTLGLVQMGPDLSYSEHKFSNNEISHMINTPTSEVRVTSIEQFMWDITVKTARGRIPEGTSLDDLYMIKHWPNLPRLTYILNAMRISAFWINKPQSINTIVEKLNIPQEDVLTYFSAASAIGILKPYKHEDHNSNSSNAAKPDKKKQGIFTALISKVSKNIKRNKNTNEVKEKQVNYV